jgi:CheY-like chemotaxis protein
MDDHLPVQVYGDPKRLSQILYNLLSNAQKFTEKGEIKIRVKMKESDEDSCLIDFKVSDSGIGIPEEKIKAIFDPFEQVEVDVPRKYGGTGLGLTIVKQLVELQNGNIHVDSRKGKGSAFTITLPFGRKKTPTELPGESSRETSRENWIHSLKMLYADDVNSNLFLMKGYADLWKFHLDTANNGADTLTLFKENTYDVILLDLQMPVMSGFQIAREIRLIEQSIGVHTPIIAVTGDLSESTQTRIFEAGMDDYLSKPVNPKLMMEKIDQLHRQQKKDRASKKPVHEEEPSDSSSVNILDFQQVDYLYGDVPDQYLQYIGMLIREFRTNQHLIREAIVEENFDEFRRIRHSLKSNVKLLRMHSLQTLLDEIRDLFIRSELPPAGGLYADKVQQLIQQILEQLESKQEVLSG